tara:strand:+ start:1251 stop:1649 length:399 start_codon:yes stop_codon:yes gene_type:complete
MALLSITFISLLMSQDSVKVKSPKQAVKYSIIPGGGQLYNEKPIKAILILGSELWMIYQFQINKNSFTNWNYSFSKSKEYYRDNRNKYAWYTFFVYIYNLVDALVDSHLSTYNDLNIEISNHTTNEKGKDSE